MKRESVAACNSEGASELQAATLSRFFSWFKTKGLRPIGLNPFVFMY